MNKDQMKGATKTAVGKAERATGKLVGSRKLEAKGIGKELEGKVQRRVGDVKAALKDSSKKRRR